MANPHRIDDNLQVQNGNYTRIHNRILEELAKIQLSGYETRIIFALWRKTYGWQKKEDFISFRQFKELTKLPKSEISRTLSRLKKRNLVVESYNSNRRIYRFNKHFTTWKELEKSTTSCRKLQQVLEKSTTTDVEIYNQKPLRQLKTQKQRAPKETLTKETLTKESIYSLFDFWKQICNHPQAHLTDTRKQKIRARLKEFSPQQLKDAVLACSQSEYHMKNNYNWLESNIFKSREKVEWWLERKGKNYDEENSRLEAPYHPD